MAEIVQLPKGNLQDVAAMMEAVAARIRSGEINPKSAACVLLDESDKVSVFGWGQTDDVHSIGLLHLGIGWLVNRKVDHG